MKSKIFNILNTKNFYLVFFIYACIAPAIRLLLIGGGEMKNFYEFIITALPDIILLFFVIFSFIVWQKGNKFNFHIFDKIVLAFILFNTIYGFIISRNIFISLQGFRITYLPVIFYFIGRIFSLNDLESLCRKVFYWLLIFGIAGLILHFGFRNFEIYLVSISGNHETAYFIPRIGSFVLMPVLFSTIMTMACLYFYYKILTEKINLYFFYIAILWSCIFLSVSRGPIMAFLIGFLFFTFIFRQWISSLIVFGIIIIDSSFWSYILVGSFTPIAWLFSSAADTLAFGEGITRVELWKRSIHDFIQRPWGYGLGYAGATAIRFLKGTNTPAAVYTSDGWYLKIACETGVLGLLSFLTVCMVFFLKGIKIIKENKFSFFTFIFSIFLLINAQCIVGNTLDFYPYISLYWLLIGFAANSFQKQ